MALTLSTTPGRVRPVYSPIVFKASGATGTITSYTVVITVDSTTITLNMLPDPDDNIEFNVSANLAGLFESEVIYQTVSSFNYVDGLKTYNINVTANISDGTTQSIPTSESTTDYYCFNGVEQVNSPFDFSDYQLTSAGNKSILSDWIGNRNIIMGDQFSFQFFEGIFGTDESNPGDILLDLYNGDTLVSTTTLYDTSVSYTATPKILSLAFTASLAGTHRIVRSSTNAFSPIRINTISKDNRFDYYRIAWVGQLGQTEYFNFTQNNENSIEIDREEYRRSVNYVGRDLYYNTEVDDIIRCHTEYVSNTMARNLKSMWFSPSVASIESGTARPILIDGDNISIFNDILEETPIYVLEFKYGNAFRVQSR